MQLIPSPKKLMNDIRSEDTTTPIPEKDPLAETSKEKLSSQKTYGRLTRTFLAGIIVSTIVLSSLFGALFGFLSGGAASIFLPRITQRIRQYFPGLAVKNAFVQVNKQQVIVEDSAVIDVVDKSSPAVVSIIISKNVPATPSSSNLFGPFGAPLLQQDPQSGQGSVTQQQIGGGSGFFITSDGFILTNKHVVDDPQASYMVVTNDNKQYPATVLAQDPARDVAVIKVDGTNFPILPLGNSDSLKIGQTIIAIGNSLGEFTNSVSRGIVSGLGRNVDAGFGFGPSERLTNIIQTDAAINPGNSGGPLIDIEGNVIGINVAMAQGAQNVGFALPINQAKRIIDQAKGGPKISIPFLGVRYIAIDANIQKQAKLPFDYGVLVQRGSQMTDLAVIPGSPADKAGIVENDIILEVNGQKITADNQLGDIIARYNVGDTLTLKVWHKGQTKDVQATLQESNV